MKRRQTALMRWVTALAILLFAGVETVSRAAAPGADLLARLVALETEHDRLRPPADSAAGLEDRSPPSRTKRVRP